MKNSSFSRKIIYLCLIAALLVPISYLSMPDRRNAEGQVTGGGVLAQMRRENGLAQAELGEIDPAGESIRLAALGFRGIAANLLWLRANDYKKTEKWDKLSATLNQITKLQPHFIKVWEFQAWNLSYNVSVEFDDYRQRYLWVTKGIDFIIGGTKYNRDEPRLLSSIGWSSGHKIGRADEKKEYRRLFRDDEDFHARMPDYINIRDTAGPDGKPDNWLLSHEWYGIAEQAAQIRPLRGQSPLIFHSRSPMALIDHSGAIEEEGNLNEYAQQSWSRSGQAWESFGNLEIPTSGDFAIRLGELERREQLTKQLQAEVEALSGVTQAQIVAEKTSKLPDDQRQALALPMEKRTAVDHQLVEAANTATYTSFEEVANRAPANLLGKARIVLSRLLDADRDSTYIRRYRSIVNYDYWKTRCEVEQRDEAIRARQFIYEADRARRQLDLEKARQIYDQAWHEWALIFNQYPQLREETEGEDIVEAIKRYKKLLADLDDPGGFPPANFPLLDLVKLHDRKHKLLGGDYTDGQTPATQAPAAESPAAESAPPEIPPAAGESPTEPSATTEPSTAESGTAEPSAAEPNASGSDGSVAPTPPASPAEAPQAPAGENALPESSSTTVPQ